MSAGSCTPGSGVVLVCGGAVVDCIAKPFDGTQVGASRTSLPGKAQVSHGGVGRNVAEVIARIGGAPRLLSATGSDEAGQQLVAAARRLGVDTACVARLPGHRTATFTALLDGSGDLVGAVADMEIFSSITPAMVDAAATGGAWNKAALAVCDANLPADTLQRLLECSARAGVPAWFEPVSVAKAPRGRGGRPWQLVAPNWDELQAMMGRGTPQVLPTASAWDRGFPEEIAEVLDEALASDLAEHILLSMGPRGVVLASRGRRAGTASVPLGVRSIAVAPLLNGVERPPDGVPAMELSVEALPERPRMLWYRLLSPLTSVRDTTGAGDALLAGTARAFAGGWQLEDAVVAGMLCAHATLFADGAVAPFLGPGLLAGLAAPPGGASRL